MLLISLWLSRSSSGLNRNVMYHFRESDTVLQYGKGLASEPQPEICVEAEVPKAVTICTP